jgi:hypothetical protein
LPELVKEFGAEGGEEIGESVAWNTTRGGPAGEAPRFDPFATPSAAPSDQSAGPRYGEPPQPTQSPRWDGQTSVAAASLSYERTPAGLSTPALSSAVIPASRAVAVGPDATVQAASAAQPVSPGPERFTWMESRLRDLGATYYLLEAWGGEGVFRFHCKMAIAGNAQLNRHFEATDPDPLRAMERVLTQVETWRGGRQP